VPIFASFHQGNTATFVDDEAVANRLQHWVRFGRSGIELQTSRTRGTRVNCSGIEAVQIKPVVSFQFQEVFERRYVTNTTINFTVLQ